MPHATSNGPLKDMNWHGALSFPYGSVRPTPQTSADGVAVRFPVRMLQLAMQELVEKVRQSPLNIAELGQVDKLAVHLQDLLAAKNLFAGRTGDNDSSHPDADAYEDQDDHYRFNEASGTPKSPTDRASSKRGNRVPESPRECSQGSFSRITDPALSRIASSQERLSLDSGRMGSVLSSIYDLSETQSDRTAITDLDHSNNVNGNRKASSSMVSCTPSEWKEVMVTVFHQLDSDGGGTISAEELRRNLIKLGMPAARTQVLINSADRNGSGEVDISEWINAINSDSKFGRELQSFVKMKNKREIEESNEENNLKDRFMLRPDSPIRMCWDLALALMCTYVAILLPWTMGFGSLLDIETLMIFQSIELVIDVTFLLDVVLNFRTGYFDPNGTLIMNWRRVGKTYLRTYFLVDLLSSIPFEDISHGEAQDIRPLKILKIPKILRALKVVGKILAGKSELVNYIEVMFASPFLRHFCRRFSTIVITVMLCHWLACGMAVTSYEWFESYQDVSLSVMRMYLSAVYFSMMTMTTVGYGDIVATNDVERAFSLCAMCVGGTFYGYAVGTIASIVSCRDLRANAYHDRMDTVHAWLEHHHSQLPQEMRRRLIRYFTLYLKEKVAVDESDLLSDLSPALEKEVGERLIPIDIRMNPIFDGLPLNAVARLLKIVSKISAEQGNTVVEPGEAGTAMFIIHKGNLILEPDYQMHRDAHRATIRAIRLNTGDSFGEEILLGIKEIYAYKVTATEFCELYSIDEGEFADLFEHMPDIVHYIKRNAQVVLGLRTYLTECNYHRLSDLDAWAPGSIEPFKREQYGNPILRISQQSHDPWLSSLAKESISKMRASTSSGQAYHSRATRKSRRSLESSLRGSVEGSLRGSVQSSLRASVESSRRTSVESSRRASMESRR